jgi:hypothetical protein
MDVVRNSHKLDSYKTLSVQSVQKLLGETEVNYVSLKLQTEVAWLSIGKVTKSQVIPSAILIEPSLGLIYHIYIYIYIERERERERAGIAQSV